MGLIKYFILSTPLTHGNISVKVVFFFIHLCFASALSSINTTYSVDKLKHAEGKKVSFKCCVHILAKGAIFVEQMLFFFSHMFLTLPLTGKRSYFAADGQAFRNTNCLGDWVENEYLH